MPIFESSNERVAGNVFKELFVRVSESHYQFNDEERRVLTDISASLTAKVAAWGVGGGVLGWEGMKRIAGPGRATLMGKLMGAGATAYMGSNWIGTWGAKERIVKRILELDTPLGGETAAILKEQQPSSPLLAARSTPLQYDAEPLRLPPIDPNQAKEPAKMYEYDSATGEVSGVLAQMNPGVQRLNREQAKLRQQQQQQEQEQQQAEPALQSPPDAFDGASGDPWASGGGGGWSDSGQQQHQGRRQQPAGLDAVPRARDRPHRTFGGAGGSSRQTTDDGWNDGFAGSASGGNASRSF